MAGIIIDKRDFQVAKDLYNKAPKYLRNALNDTIRGIKTDVLGKKIGVQTELNVSRKKVLEAIKIRMAKNNRLQVGIRSININIPAYDKTKPWKIKGQKPGLNFQGRRKNRPRAKSKVTGKRMNGKAFQYSFIFKKNKGRKTFDNAFMATMKSGHTGLFVREGSGIKEIFSSTVMDVFSNESVIIPLLNSAEERFNKNLVKQINRVLN